MKVLKYVEIDDGLILFEPMRRWWPQERIETREEKKKVREFF